MPLNAISKRFDAIVEFSAFKDFISFDINGKNKVKRIENNKVKVTIEVKLEARCNISIIKRVLKRLREVHPYEEPAIDIIPLIDEENL